MNEDEKRLMPRVKALLQEAASMQNKTRELARVKRADIAEVYNDMVGLVVDFEYEGGGQSLSGYVLEAGMVIRFMAALGVTRLRDAEGKSCWVTCSHTAIHLIEPLHKKDGAPFDVDAWSKWAEERLVPTGITYRELRTGQRPEPESNQ